MQALLRTSEPHQYGSISRIEGNIAEPLFENKHHKIRPRLTALSNNSEGSLELEPDRPAQVEISQGHASIANEIVNVTKNLVGGGVLSLSGGIAIYANAPSAAVSAAFWILAMGALLGYFALLIAKVCSFTKATTYRECWHRSMGEHGGLAVSIANTLNPAMGDLAYAAILSQTFQSLLESIGIQVTRIQSLLLITLFALLPLCLLKNLYVLAPFSAVGTGGVILTAAAMVLRCVDGSYQPGGKYYSDIRPQYQPSFGTRNQSMSTAILPLVCMLFQAFVMHYVRIQDILV